MHSVRVTVHTRACPQDAMDFLADLERLPLWSGCVRTSTRLSGDGGVGSRYLVRTRVMHTTEDLRGVVTERTSRHLRFLTHSPKVDADERIVVTPDATGSQVTITADYHFTWPTRLLAGIVDRTLDRLWRDSVPRLQAQLEQVAEVRLSRGRQRSWPAEPAEARESQPPHHVPE